MSAVFPENPYDFSADRVDAIIVYYFAMKEYIFIVKPQQQWKHKFMPDFCFVIMIKLKI